MKRPTSLATYLTVVVTAAIVLLAANLENGFRGSTIPWELTALLLAGMVAGEVMPVLVGRGRETSTIIFSGGFVFAMLLTAPPLVALTAQVGGVLIQHVRARRAWRMLLFNLSLYVLTLLPAHVVFVRLSGAEALTLDAISPREVVAILVTGAVYVLINHVLLSLVIAFAGAMPVRQSIRGHRLTLLSYGLDIGIAPVAIPILQYSPLLFPLLIMPAVILHHSTKMAASRHHQALHDVLTGLPNRGLLRTEFDRLLKLVASGAGAAGVVLIDLDHFKEINDTLGHQVGDELLIEVSQRLRSMQRDGDTVARLGGDEFAVLLELDPARARQEAAEFADRLLGVLQQPYFHGEMRLDVLGSLGVAVTPEDGLDVEILMSRADIALYVAKEERGCAVFFDPAHEEQVPSRLSLLAELRDGLEDGEIEVHYQPQIDLQTGVAVGAEALAWWNSPTRGLLDSSEFVPLAEETGLIMPLTWEVLRQALDQLRIWQDSARDLSVSVNISTRCLTDALFPDQLAEMIGRRGVSASRLTLEVTEEALQGEPDRTRVVLASLRDLGVRIAVDYYGTGYSSLRRLRHLAIDELKIDQSFIQPLLLSANDEVIVRSTVELGHTLGMTVTADGPPDQATLSMLAALGCDRAQGPFVSAPLNARDFGRWVTEQAVLRDRPATLPG